MSEHPTKFAVTGPAKMTFSVRSIRHPVDMNIEEHQLKSAVDRFVVCSLAQMAGLIIHMLTANLERLQRLAALSRALSSTVQPHLGL